MREDPQTIESRLLDLHLDRLDPDQSREVEEAVAESPQLASQSRALRTLLGLLDAVDVPVPSASLADAVMVRIDEHTNIFFHSVCIAIAKLSEIIQFG